MQTTEDSVASAVLKAQNRNFSSSNYPQAEISCFEFPFSFNLFLLGFFTQCASAMNEEWLMSRVCMTARENDEKFIFFAAPCAVHSLFNSQLTIVLLFFNKLNPVHELNPLSDLRISWSFSLLHSSAARSLKFELNNFHLEDFNYECATVEDNLTSQLVLNVYFSSSYT